MVWKNYNQDWSKDFYYDPTSPSGLRWSRTAGIANMPSAKRVGDVVGGINSKSSTKGKYYSVKTRGSTYLVHRIVYCLTKGEIPENLAVDHIDGNSLNNVSENLRLVSLADNSRNQKKRKNNTTGVTGVSFSEKPYPRFVVQWTQEDGKYTKKSFSVNKFGTKEQALEEATKFRNEVFGGLLGYTARHGVADET